MTPPPCLLRKQRQEDGAGRQKRDKVTRSEVNWALAEKEKPYHSSASSLSTLTDEHVTCKQPIQTENLVGECYQQRHSFLKSHAEVESGDNYSSLKRKVSRQNIAVGSPQFQSRLAQPAVPSPLINNGNCYAMDAHDLKRNSVMSVYDHRSEFKSTESEISNLCASIEALKDKVTRLTAPISHAAKQISSSIKEANDLRTEAIQICDLAKSSKSTFDKLTEEAEGLVEFLRRIAACQSQKQICSCAQPVKSNGQNGHSNTLPTRKTHSNSTTCKSKEVERSLECIVETPSYISTQQSFAQKQTRRRHGRHCSKSESESSDPSSSDNEAKVSVVQKSQYHKS